MIKPLVHPRLSVVMPVFNEKATVARAIARLRSLPLPAELIVVDDGSTDGTRMLLEQLRVEGWIDVLVMHDSNRGKGSAVCTGIQHASGEITVIQDADLEYDPLELPRLMEPILDGRADAVYGSRFLGGPQRVLYFWHRLGNGLLTLLSNMLTNINLSDMETCYKMVKTDLLKSLPLRSRRFGIEPELTARLAQAGARIYEVPISYSGRTYEDGKKINWKDGVAAIWHILRCNLLPPRARPYVPVAGIAGQLELWQDRISPAAPARGVSYVERADASGVPASGCTAASFTDTTELSVLRSSNRKTSPAESP